MSGAGRNGLLAAGLALGVSLPSVPAGATVITFEDAPSPFESYTVSGVTFTAVAGGEVQLEIGPNDTNGILGVQIPRQELRADIAGGTSSVSVDLGDYGADADTLFLEIYDSSDNLLAQATQFIDENFGSMVTLTLSSPGIAYAIFGARPPALQGSSVYADNFTIPSVPVPATLPLLGGALAALGLAGRSRRR